MLMGCGTSMETKGKGTCSCGLVHTLALMEKVHVHYAVVQRQGLMEKIHVHMVLYRHREAREMVHVCVMWYKHRN